jgi:predicted nucleotidyltransferase
VTTVFAHLRPQIEAFCHRWKVAELSLFGSQARGDATPESDVDLLITFLPEAQWSSFDWVDMQDELQKIFGRPVDLVSRRALKNPFRRQSILADQQVIYAA